MPDLLDEKYPCKDCGDLFYDNALADGQCFLCWAKEAEDNEDYELFLDDTLDNIIDDILEGGAL
jgi:hypothetical protein